MTIQEPTFEDIVASPEKIMMPDGDPDEDESHDSLSGSPKRKRKRDNASLRKAPQAPKRFKSSYICFFMAKQPEIKEELGDKATVTEISKRSAEMWRNLPQEERAHWDDVAAKDKQRYMVEKASYTGPWQVPWKRAKKDPSAPKRPMSAFLYFSQGRRKMIKDENPEMKNTEVSRMLGEMWRNATEDDRKPHVDKEKEEREKYKIAIAEWRKDYEKKKEEQRKQQAEQQAQWSQNQQYPPEGADQQHQQTNPHMQYAHHPYMAPPPHGYAPYPPPYPPYRAYPPPPGSYQYPTSGKQPVILGPNGMPVYQQMMPPPQHQQPPPQHQQHQQPPPQHQQPPPQHQQSPHGNMYSHTPPQNYEENQQQQQNYGNYAPEHIQEHQITE